MISVSGHRILDYLLALSWVCSQWVCGFDNNAPELWLTLLMGLSLIFYSILTDYSGRSGRAMTLKTNLALDLATAGLVLLLALLLGVRGTGLSVIIVLTVVQSLIALATPLPSNGWARLRRLLHKQKDYDNARRF